jgi:hypothetical protein
MNRIGVDVPPLVYDEHSLVGPAPNPCGSAAQRLFLPDLEVAFARAVAEAWSATPACHFALVLHRAFAGKPWEPDSFARGVCGIMSLWNV